MTGSIISAVLAVGFGIFAAVLVSRDRAMYRRQLETTLRINELIEALALHLNQEHGYSIDLTRRNGAPKPLEDDE